MARGVTLKQVAENLKNWLANTKHYRTCAWFVTLVSSLMKRRIVLVAFDGTDWVHTWAAGALVTSQPAFNAPAHTQSSLALFTYQYRPKAGDIVMDLGAGVGTEIKAFSDWVGPQGHVYAIEADPNAFRRLSKLIGLLRLHNVTALNLAVGATEGVAHLTQDDADGLVNRVVENTELFTISVPMVSLDTLASDLNLVQINYLKINIEGAERQALIGFDKHSIAVKNWCVSCHDFLGLPETKTFEFVTSWLRERYISVTRHPNIEGSPWIGFYVYASERN